MKTRTLFALAASVAGLAWPTIASAQDEAVDPEVAAFDLSSTVSVVSDYRFRGISLSNRKPAVQASADVAHKSGVYAGVWGSNIARYGGAKVELDLYLGWKKSLGSVDVDVGVLGYLYPGGHSVNYVEVYTYLGKTIGPAALRAGVNYAPSQRNIGGDDNLYLSGEARVGIPGTPVTLLTGVGYENGPFAGADGRKWDWTLGGEYNFAPFTLGLLYADTDVSRTDDPTKNSKAGIVASASVEF
jgi:uncharacterized protein (TIGR02001 family)